MKVFVQIDIKKFIQSGNLKTLKELLKEQEPATILEMIEELETDEKAIVFRLLPRNIAAEVFSELDPEEQMELIQLFKESTLKDIIASMDYNDRIELFEELPASVLKKFLDYLPSEDRKQTLDILNYPEDSAARIMDPLYFEIKPDITLQEAINLIKKYGKNKENLYTIFITDDNGHLIGSVELQDLILSHKQKLIQEIMDDEPIAVFTTDSQEEAMQLMQKYNLLSLPVVDKDYKLVGIISVDDVLDVMEEESTEDIHKMASMGAIYSSFFNTSYSTLILKRVPWLIGLLFLETLNSFTISKYEKFLTIYPILAAFFSTIAGTGGNVGSQISALVIRGMALGEIKIKDFWRVIWKEIFISLTIGMVSGLLIFGRAFMLSKNWTLNMSVGIAMALIIVYADLMGAILPFVATFLKFDPAIMAGPLLTTLVDVSGIAIYFCIVNLLL
jgi:magnesium transporter